MSLLSFLSRTLSRSTKTMMNERGFKRVDSEKKKADTRWSFFFSMLMRVRGWDESRDVMFAVGERSDDWSPDREQLVRVSLFDEPVVDLLWMQAKDVSQVLLQKKKQIEEECQLFSLYSNRFVCLTLSILLFCCEKRSTVWIKVPEKKGTKNGSQV